MIEQKKLIGIVTWPPNRQASYVRVNIPNWKDDIPLSVKATFTDFDWRDFEAGAVVEVERSDPRDARRFKVLRLMKAVAPKSEFTIALNMEVRNADEFRRNQKMDNRVRFFISYKYLQNKAIYPVMRQSLGLDDSVARELYRQQANGFWVICREEQFARFMIYRNNAGIQNGFMDLKADIVPACGDIYERIASAAGVDRGVVKKVLLALNYSRATVEERLEMRTAEVDVSQYR